MSQVSRYELRSIRGWCRHRLLMSAIPLVARSVPLPLPKSLPMLASSHIMAQAKASAGHPRNFGSDLFEVAPLPQSGTAPVVAADDRRFCRKKSAITDRRYRGRYEVE